LQGKQRRNKKIVPQNSKLNSHSERLYSLGPASLNVCTD
jgi:hypothetical protein